MRILYRIRGFVRWLFRRDEIERALDSDLSDYIERSAALATVLAGLGLYGVLAYSVAQRSREIGLRFALGAPASGIRRMVIRQVTWIVVAGIALGVTGAILLGRAARSLLFGIEAADPVALVTAAAVLAAVTFGAAYIPARRASRVDPMTVLRYE